MFGAPTDGAVPAELQPEFFIRDDVACSLQPLPGALPVPELHPHTCAVLRVWARWQHPCTPQTVTAILSCTTERGPAVLEATAEVRRMRRACEHAARS